MKTTSGSARRVFHTVPQKLVTSGSLRVIIGKEKAAAVGRELVTRSNPGVGLLFLLFYFIIFSAAEFSERDEASA